MTDDHLISLQPGTVIGGKYEVVKCLGSGSMGLVYACRHRELQGQMVAVKVLFPEVAQDKIAAARFRNEILAAYVVSHPNVVRAYEYLRDGDLVAYTMEYVGGGDLAERLSRQERMPIAEVIRLLSQMAAGVQAIHDAGIVHRDLKPENILITKEGNVKIADFGIARNRHGPKLTEHGGVVGTIDYVAPEYMLKSQVDWRSDIYAIGILAYEMVTGESPFRGDSVYATMTKRLKTDPDFPSKVRPECPPALDQVILRAMNRDPLQRYQSAMEILMDLQRIASEQGMRTAMTGGFFIPNHDGSTYIGPSVSSATEESASRYSGGVSASPGTVASGGGAAVSGAQSSVTWPGAGSSTEVAREGARHRPAASWSNEYPGQNDDDRSATQVLPLSEVSGLNGDYGTAGGGGSKLEQVLGGRDDLVSDGWAVSEQLSIKHGNITSRVRDLSHKYHEQHARRSYMMDAIALFVAMIIGIGFGCVVLKLFFPSLLASMPFFRG